MPKWRKIHTKAVESVDLNDMPDDFTRLLWMMLPLILDRRGRGMDTAVWVRSKAMPLREDVTCEMVTEAMDWYAEYGMIERYQANDRRYFWIPTWHKYQGDTRREADSNFPAPPSYADPFIDDSPEDPQDDEPDDDQGDSDDKPNAGASQDQVGSRSRSDADSDTDSDAKAEREARAHEELPPTDPDNPESAAWIADLESTVPPPRDPPHSEEEFHERVKQASAGYYARAADQPWLAWGADHRDIEPHNGTPKEAVQQVGYLLDHEFGVRPP